MKQNILICGVCSMIVTFIFSMLGLGINNGLVCCIGLLCFMVVSVVFMTVEAFLYIDFKDTKLEDVIEDDIDIIEDARKKVDELGEILK